MARSCAGVGFARSGTLRGFARKMSPFTWRIGPTIWRKMLRVFGRSMTRRPFSTWASRLSMSQVFVTQRPLGVRAASRLVWPSLPTSWMR
jgi:hypothetical protein